MLRSLLARLRALTRRQTLIFVAAVILLVMVVLALLIGEATGAPRWGASAALILLALAAVGAVGYVVAAVPFLRSREAPPPDVPADIGSRPSLALSQGFAPLVAQNDRTRELQWYSELSRMPARSILAHGLSTRSQVARDFFALRATAGRFDADALAELVLAGGDDIDAVVRAVGPCDPNALVALARLTLAGGSEKSREIARGLRSLAVPQHARLSPLSRQALVQQAIVAGQRELAVSALEMLPAGDYPARFFHLDLVNPHGGAVGVSERAWLTAVGGVFRRAGLEPIELLDTGPTVFDRLSARAQPCPLKGPLVSVVMSCFEPGEGLLTAVRSMSAQTWQNWELLITDDASPTDPSDMLARAAAIDARVRIIRNERNAGTYVRRNEAIAQARGELITMHDSDDWAHPRRLEVQVRHLLDNPGLIANVSQSMRVDEQLLFTQPRGTSIRLTESSILFWRERALDAIGGFDTVRKAADSEFRMRLEAAIGAEIPLIDLEAPLSLIRYDARSLSGGDLGDGWLHPARVAYRGAQLEWRRRQKSAGLPLRITGSDAHRPFPAHGHLTGTGPSTLELDVLYVLDPRDGIAQGAPVAAAAAELARLAAAGLRVGLRRAEAVVPERPPLETSSPLQSLINDGVVHEVLSVDVVSTAVLVVRHRAALAGVSPLDPAVRASEVLIVRTRPAIPAAIVDRALDMLAPDRTSTRAFTDDSWPSELDRIIVSKGRS